MRGPAQHRDPEAIRETVSGASSECFSGDTARDAYGHREIYLRKEITLATFCWSYPVPVRRQEREHGLTNVPLDERGNSITLAELL